MESTTMPGPDVTEMVAVHDVFRDVLSAAPALLDTPAILDVQRAAMLNNVYGNVLDFLAVHHHGEDELMFPLLRSRVADQLDLIDRVAAQHHDVDDLVAASRAALTSWAPGNRAEAAAAADVLRRLGLAMDEHLDGEERDILPLCREHMSLPEWGALPAHAMKNFGGDKLWLILGLILQRNTPAKREEMLAYMPPPLMQMWIGFGEQAFSDLMSQIGPPLG